MSFSSDLKVRSGSTVVAATTVRVPLATGQNIKCRSVTIRADRTNTGDIYVGDVGVTIANGYHLSPGETITYQVFPEDCKYSLCVNLVAIYLDADVSGEGVSYTFVRD